jgi:enolase
MTILNLKANWKIRSSAEQVDCKLAAKYPIISIEDGMDENDWEG